MDGNTSFHPRNNGFHFSNNNIRWSWGLMNGRQLCGGMAFASLDFFYHRMVIPPNFNPPEEGTPLHNYIVRRQMHAHTFAIPRLIAGERRWRTSLYESSLRTDRFFGPVKRLIDERRPVPILLAAVNGTISTNSHWVTVIGYESFNNSMMGSEVFSRLLIYDNNKPEIVCELTPDSWASNFRITNSRRRYGYYVPFEDYTSIRPTEEEMAVSPNTTQLATNPFNLQI